MLGLRTLIESTTPLDPLPRETRNGTIQVSRRELKLKCTGWEEDSQLRPDKMLSPTYRSKPLYVYNGEFLYGELVIVRLLEADGWEAVWTDNFHSRGIKKKFWRALPPNGIKCLSKSAACHYLEIVRANCGKSSGFFDVFAWRNDGSDDFRYIECKRKNESANANEKRWIQSTVPSVIKPEQLLVVTIGCEDAFDLTA